MIHVDWLSKLEFGVVWISPGFVSINVGDLYLDVMKLWFYLVIKNVYDPKCCINHGKITAVVLKKDYSNGSWISKSSGNEIYLEICDVLLIW